MPFILDASVTAAWAFSDENHSDAAAALSLLAQDAALVPQLWWFEVRNILLVNERRRRMTQSGSSIFLQKLSLLPITVEPLPGGEQGLELARAHRLTFYDAAYLELAKNTCLPLATLDAELIRAAAAEGISLIRAAA